MEDRYLFKAKRLDNGEWVEGSLVFTPDADKEFRAIIIPCYDNGEYTEGVNDECLGFEMWHKVDENTICQCTGLTDKNGNKIWENDIVRFDNCSNYPVVWDGDYKAFGSCYYSDFDHLSKYKNTELEVIGNIFDNPELLESEDRMNEALDSLHRKILNSNFAEEVTETEIEALIEAKNSKWIPCSERMPEAEKEVLILTAGGKITTAMYEDGTISEDDSCWWWNDIEFDYDEETDTNYIPEGWWECRHFNADDVYNNAADKEVVAWQPLPEPYREETEHE